MDAWEQFWMTRAYTFGLETHTTISSYAFPQFALLNFNNLMAMFAEIFESAWMTDGNAKAATDSMRSMIGPQ